MKVKTNKAISRGGQNVSQISEGESRLLKANMKTIRDEARLWLLRNLLSRHLATPDIYNFLKNQEGLRLTQKGPDWLTMRGALRAKVKDIKATRRRCLKDYFQMLSHDMYFRKIAVWETKRSVYHGFLLFNRN